MADKTSIEWTDATWNPVRGCTRVSPGCGGPNRQGGCYAEKIAARFSDPDQPFHGFAIRTPHGGQWTGKLALVEDALTLPLRWKRPRRIFVNSMSDLFHENLPDEAIDAVFCVMSAADHHQFQVLTKRSDRMRRYFSVDRIDRLAARSRQMFERGILPNHGLTAWPIPNVWLGVSAEDQERADERIPDLLRTAAGVRFVSAEPLLGPIDLSPKDRVAEMLSRWYGPDGFDETGSQPVRERASWLFPKIDLLIAGAESGPRARDCDIEWVRSLRDQCVRAGVAFFWKQHAKNGRKIPTPELDGQRWTQLPDLRHV